MSSCSCDSGDCGGSANDATTTARLKTTTGRTWQSCHRCQRSPRGSLHCVCPELHRRLAHCTRTLGPRWTTDWAHTQSAPVVHETTVLDPGSMGWVVGRVPCFGGSDCSHRAGSQSSHERVEHELAWRKTPGLHSEQHTDRKLCRRWHQHGDDRRKHPRLQRLRDSNHSRTDPHRSCPCHCCTEGSSVTSETLL